MDRFNQSYLNEVIETQGRLFDEVKLFVPGVDVRDFIFKYMNSRTRKLIDQGQAYLCTMDTSVLYEYFKKYDRYMPLPGDDLVGFVPNWMGQFYAYFQWYYSLYSSDVIQLVPIDFLSVAYNGLHDLDLFLAIKKVGDQLKLIV